MLWKTCVLFLSGHSDSLWVTVLCLGLRREEGRLRFGSASSLEQHPAASTISCIICPQRPMHYRNENSFSDSLHCLARSNLAVRNSWPCRVGQWKGETRERPVLTQISHCERIRFPRLSLTTDCQGLHGELPGSRSLWLRQLVIFPFYLFIFLLNGTKRQIKNKLLTFIGSPVLASPQCSDCAFYLVNPF